MMKQQPSPPSSSLTATHVVLDIDNTLLCSIGVVYVLYCLGIVSKAEYLDVRRRLYVLHMDEPVPGMCLLEDGERNQFHYDGLYELWGVLRPYSTEFLHACFQRFEKVIIWTAGSAEYARAVCKIIFRDTAQYPHLIWSFHDCHPISQNYLEKPLSKLAAHLGVEVDQFLLIDDNPISGRTTPDFMLQIKPFRPPNELIEDKSKLTFEDACQLQVNLEKPHHISLMRRPVEPVYKSIAQWLLKPDDILLRLSNILTDPKYAKSSNREIIEAALKEKVAVPYALNIKL